MKQLYRVGLLVPGNAPPLEDGALLVGGQRILAIGSFKQLRKEYDDAKVIDYADYVMVPALVNAHSHLDLTDYPIWAKKVGETEEPADFVDWILQLIRVKRTLSDTDFRSSIQHGLSLSIASGTGVIGDILAYLPAVDCYDHVSIAGRLFLETLGQNPEHKDQAYEWLCEALSYEVKSDIIKGISPHSPYTISADYLQQIYQECSSKNIFSSTHIAEPAAEVDFTVAGTGLLATKFYPAIGWESFVPMGAGLRPVSYVANQGGLFNHNLLVHGVQLSEEDIDLLASRRMAVALCPRSNKRLNVGKAPVGRMLDSGVRLALGTDSLASCDSLSIWDEMAFAHHWFGGALDAPTLFYLATLSGADALGLARDYGSLEVGKVASFQILKPKSKVAKSEVFDYFVAPGCDKDIAHVFIKGKEEFCTH